MEQIYDVIIVGGGPAGYTAAIYCARAALKTLVLEKTAPGGQMAGSGDIDNYPGFSEEIDGFELSVRMQKQAERFGVSSVFSEVTGVKVRGAHKQVAAGGRLYLARALILATGASPRKLGLPMEQELRGKGVCYCATCDGPLFRGKTVVVAGGGNTAVTDALFLSKLCKEVIVVHRRDRFSAATAYRKKLCEQANVRFLWSSVVTELLHGDRLTGVTVRDLKTGEAREIPCDGIFVAIGNVPNTALFKGSLALTPDDYLDADESTKTDAAGVFAAGDVRRKPLRQIVTAVSDGAVAAHMAEEYLSLREKA